MHTTKGHIQRMPRLLMRHSLVLLGRVGEGITVRYRLNTGEFGIEGVQCWLGADGGFDVCFLCDEFVGFDWVGDT